MTIHQLPSSYESGKVVCRIVHAVADTPNDPDAYPQARPAQGTVTFIPDEKQRRVVDADYPAIVMHEPVTVTLNDEGRIIDPEGNEGIWLIVGVWVVQFNLVGGSVQPYPVLVTSEHTMENPLDLARALPYVPPTNTVIHVLPIPSGGQPGQVLGMDVSGDLRWVTL